MFECFYQLTDELISVQQFFTMNVSLLESLWITLIEVITALFLSTAISTFLGWAFTRSYQNTKILKLTGRQRELKAL
jgi:ABC-type nitrate/sulfonate/bicarbonate transport system permease component